MAFAKLCTLPAPDPDLKWVSCFNY